MDKTKIMEKLNVLGYMFDEDKDGWAVAFLIDKVTNYIKNECNISKIPKELDFVAIDMVCGEFLQVKKASGQLEGFKIDLDAAILRQVSEGDTNVQFSTDKIQSNEERLEAVIYHLLNHGKYQLLKFRKFTW